jgi:ADP-ribose pyrophosphatase YjhB (NUDIX family)
MAIARKEPTLGDLLRWSESLSACARTGLAFTKSLYERERFEEILKVAADIGFVANERLKANGQPRTTKSAAMFVEEWMQDILPGTAGYQTPRVAIGALVGNEAGELLLVKRADSGVWLYPTGWADVGYSAAEIAVKEVKEETGIDAEVKRLAMVVDGLQIGTSTTPLYSLVFHCTLIGGSLKAHPLECSDVGFFARSELPEALAGAKRWVDHAFKAISGDPIEVYFDRPREPIWRTAAQPERPSRK